MAIISIISAIDVFVGEVGFELLHASDPPANKRQIHKITKGKTMNTNIALKLASGLLFGSLLTACVEDTGSATPPPNRANQDCLAAVAQTTGNSEVRILSSEPREANILVIVGVGPDAAPWQCITYGDGTTEGIMSLSNEGSL